MEAQRTPDKIEVLKQAEQKTEIKFIGTIRPKKGHTLFEVNKTTGEINLAEYKSKSSVSKKKTVIVKPDCLYISALNKQNAIRKIKQRYSV